MDKLIRIINKLVLAFNKRTIRTVVQLALGFAIGAPLVLGLLPSDQATSAQVVEILAVCAFITRAWNLLEDNGLIPAWLKDDATAALTPRANANDVSVELTLDDNFSAGMHRAAQAAKDLGSDLGNNDTRRGDG